MSNGLRNPKRSNILAESHKTDLFVGDSECMYETTSPNSKENFPYLVFHLIPIILTSMLVDSERPAFSK